MSRVRPVPGGRAVEVEPERIEGWIARFADRHGAAEIRVTEAEVEITATDGATATFPTRGGTSVLEVIEKLAEPRRIGLVLVRLGGHSIGVAFGGRVEVSTTDRKQVHGRIRAGGWSQQRFARRREGQARVALQAAADDVARVLVPRLPELDSVVLGGDWQALDVLRNDRRLSDVFRKAEARVLDVPEPRRAVLDEAAQRARCVEIVIQDTRATGSKPDRMDTGEGA
ncbi:acVLRF1 family peptidyl-tRNA hydrolase [Lentzea sp. BCCO 10_0061]|uniref:AcVLRF1 family peptidyl-tRNA hydrolase n=1 Tax=Lentzea sokolovensis TaxID=3095429 RepID=A0ABU4VEV2_9PSEU|nr:acVLRF1 family peptidyl-tRNA hydrolase [Lentzea sp. BCCO 10_0061]MDX8149463.1 acVLRF1 family peptidyl-tRNA hydrolase [Lentzea sp. BCCO 10_0061]